MMILTAFVKNEKESAGVAPHSIKVEPPLKKFCTTPFCPMDSPTCIDDV